MLIFLRRKLHSKLSVPKYYKAKFHFVKKKDDTSIVVYNSDADFRIEKHTNGFPDVNNTDFEWQPCTKSEFEFQVSEVMRKTQKELCN